MSYAPEYNPTTSFADDESNQASGRATVRTVALDTELANVASSIDGLIDNQKAIQRDDNKLRDFVVEPYALSTKTRAMLATQGVIIRGEWAANTEYALKDLIQRNSVAYICQLAHNSGPAFNLGFWLAISGDGSAESWAEQASASQNAAAASASAALISQSISQASAAQALISQSSAASSALAAQNSANSIAGLAPVNLSAFQLAFLANNNATGARSTLGAAAAADVWTKSDHANTVDPSKGAGIPAFKPTLNYVAGSIGAALMDTYINLMWFITSQTERAAIKGYTSTTDYTALLNAALAFGKRVYVPAGKWLIDTDIGAQLITGSSIVGDGLMKTQFILQPRGGSTAEIAAYTKGMGIKRAFTPGIANAYVTGCYLADFSLLLTFPAYSAGNYKQVGIDLSNITRSVVERVHVGTLGVPGQAICPAPVAADACQGWPIMFGTRAGGIDYCGGEVNTVRDCLFWGGYKPFVSDDSVLRPNSSSHAGLVENCDIQGGHQLFGQESPYTAGFVARMLTLQGNYRQSGNANPTVGAVMAGYNGEIHLKYTEFGSACDVSHQFASTSKNCKLDVAYFDYTGASVGAFLDSGTDNYMRWPRGVGGLAPVGKFYETFNKGWLRVSAKFYWDTVNSVVVILSSYGVTSIVRNAAGNYTINLSRPMPGKDQWAGQVSIQANTSFSFGGANPRDGSQSATAFRFDTYSQVGGVTAAVDPTMVWFSGEQV